MPHGFVISDGFPSNSPRIRLYETSKASLAKHGGSFIKPETMRRLLPRRKKPTPPSNPPQETSSDTVPAHVSLASDGFPFPSFPDGVKVSHDCPDATVDICFIHGLTGDRDNTWTANGQSRPWFEVLLPPRLPKARILTYGYDAYAVKRVVSINRLHDHAMNFLNDLTTDRVSCNASARPLIFVAHSLGGLVCKKAILLSRNSPELHLRGVFKCVKGIIFMGTPHKGSWMADWAKISTAALGLVKLANKSLLEVLETDDQFLESIQVDFLTMIREQREGGRPLEVTCFFEELPLTVGPLRFTVVSKESATLEGYKSLSIHADHKDMVRFVSVEENGFKRLLGELMRWESQIGKGPACTNSALDEADAWIRSKHYTAERLKIERISGETLPMDQCYINLAMVEHADAVSNRSKDGDTAPQSSPFSLAARLKIETLDTKLEVALPTIFDPRKKRDGSANNPRRILIRGGAGVGKTTLCKKIVHDFTHRKMWQGLFNRVLWVPLRNLKLEGKVNPGYNLKNLFYDEYFSQGTKGNTLAEELFREVESSKGDRTLFILDGLDEVMDILHGCMGNFFTHLFSQPNIIITTRPHAKLPTLVDKADLELETIGFHPEQVKDYLEKTIRDQQKVKKIQSFLQGHSLIQGLVRIPIQLDALCFTWDEGFVNKSVPETMTAIYEAIEPKLWGKDILRLEKQFEGKPITEDTIRESTLDEIRELVDAELRLLEAFGFAGLYNDVIDLEPSHRSEIRQRAKPAVQNLLLNETLPRLSFLRTSDPLSEYSQRSYHFLHLTFQEYFAARYFVRQWKAGELLICVDLYNKKDQNIEPAVFLRMHKYNVRYNIFWRFVAGLLSVEEEIIFDFFKIVEEEPLDLLGPTHQRLVMHCLSEVIWRNEKTEFGPLRARLEERLSRWLLFECSLSGDVFLARESEFPEHKLLTTLKNGSHVQRLRILEALCFRAYLPETIVNALAGLLQDEDSKVRYAAARALAIQSTLPDAAINTLIGLLWDEDWDVQSAAARVLANQSTLPDTTVNTLIGLLRDKDSEVRYAAVRALKNQSTLPDATINTLIGLLQDKDWYVQSAAARVLANQSTLIEGLLRDEDSNVRSAAAQALANQSTLLDVTINTLEGLLQDEDWCVRSDAAKALSYQSTLPDAIINMLTGLLQNENSDVRSAAAQALVKQSTLPDATINTLEGLLWDENRYVRSDAAQALANQSTLPDTTINTLVGLLQDKNSYIRSAALANQSTPPDVTINAFMAHLQDKDWYIRSAATRALANQSTLPDVTINILEGLLQDENSDARSNAAQALVNQSTLPDTTINTLEGLLWDENSYIRSNAARALANQSTLPDTTINTLEGLLCNENSYVRFDAAQALANQSTLLDATINAFIGLLQDKNSNVRSDAAWALANQSTLPDAAINALVGLLRDENSTVRNNAAWALAYQSTLPDATINVLMGLLQDKECYIRSAAAQALANQSNKMIESIEFVDPKRSAITLYQVLLQRSFREQLSWSIIPDTNSCVLDMRGGSKEAAFKDQAEYNCFIDIVGNTREALDISGYELWDRVGGT